MAYLIAVSEVPATMGQAMCSLSLPALFLRAISYLEDVVEAIMQRIATAVWKGGPRAGSGTVSSSSGTLHNLPFSQSYISEEHPCTNPCELLAAAHASCVALAVVQEFADLGHVPQSVTTDAILSMEEESGVLQATRSYLDVQIRGLEITEEDATEIVQRVVLKCPISHILRASVEITARVEVLPAAISAGHATPLSQ